MTQLIKILLISFIFALISCNPSTSKQEARQEKPSAKVDTLLVEESVKPKSTKDLRNDCIRGQAEPIVLKSVFPKTKFTLQPDSLTAIETVKFNNGDKLIIKNWGCEYYTLDFRFETSRFQKDTTELEFWFNTAIQLLTEVKKGIDAPIDIKKGINALAGRCESSFHMQYESFKLGDEVDFGEGEIRSFVSIDRIEKMTEDKFAMTVSFAVGPL